MSEPQTSAPLIRPADPDFGGAGREQIKTDAVGSEFGGYNLFQQVVMLTYSFRFKSTLYGSNSEPLRLGVVLCLLFALVGCDIGREKQTTVTQSLISEAAYYEDPVEHKAFLEALKAAGIPHTIEIHRGREMVSWKAEQHKAVSVIKESLFGPALPSGRNLSSDPYTHKLFKAWLAENKIPYTTSVSRGREYVVWAEEDSKKVKQWKHFPPFSDTHIKR